MVYVLGDQEGEAEPSSGQGAGDGTAVQHPRAGRGFRLASLVEAHGRGRGVGGSSEAGAPKGPKAPKGTKGPKDPKVPKGPRAQRAQRASIVVRPDLYVGGKA